jgi:hypothetical protein
METAVEVWVQDIREDVKYTLRIDFDNPVIEPDLQRPHGPHIGYHVIRHNKQAPKGVTGHILINQVERLPDRGRSQYTIDDNSTPRALTTRVFFPPSRPKTYLERIETTNIFQINGKFEIKKEFKREIRGRSYRSPDFLDTFSKILSFLSFSISLIGNPVSLEMVLISTISASFAFAT